MIIKFLSFLLTSQSYVSMIFVLLIPIGFLWRIIGGRIK